MQSATVERLLQGEGANHILPFFWQHGESEARLREMMGVIRNAGCGAVCVESRPHPDFCGTKWWADMDVILDEAEKRGMKVWILDDSHFPTGYANGALVGKPVELRRQSLVCGEIRIPKSRTLFLPPDKLRHPRQPSYHGKDIFFDMIGKASNKEQFDDDRLLGVFACPVSGRAGEILDLTDAVTKQPGFCLPDGEWHVYTLHLSRNFGAHRNYINMMDPDSCRVLIDAVYEPHWEHYREKFGNTIAGFFSDEPEIGNGLLYKKYNWLGTKQDLPWSAPLERALREALGDAYPGSLILLWENDLHPGDTAKLRYRYMDLVTRLVKDAFSYQLGDWCRAHGVSYIGHVIEDNNQHARLGSSLGHYFRGLAGQDMAGIDDIGGQVLPQQEDSSTTKGILGGRDGEFYHYALAKLAASAAALEPSKHGRAMCEIFGNYGWEEGVQLEKYLADHFMVRGINHFVPHAFTGKSFPDTDCPPHFWADGNDAQIRHFGKLMDYMNRVCELISDGHPITPAAILYHGEAEWSGRCMLMQKPAHVLADAQIDYLFLPQDVFAQPESYRASFDKGLTVNTQEFKALVIPYAQFITLSAARGIVKLQEAGFPVLYLDELPEGFCDGDDAELLSQLHQCRIVRLDELVPALEAIGARDVTIRPAARLVRVLHYIRQDGKELYDFVNEDAEVWRGTVRLPGRKPVTVYDAWENCLEKASVTYTEEETIIEAALEPRKSLILLCEEVSDRPLHEPMDLIGMRKMPLPQWDRACCRALDYPTFCASKAVTLPDKLEKEQPKFSGFVRYETEIHVPEGKQALLEITDAAEGVELFVNGISAGLQIVPPFRYEISPLLRLGANRIAIEVATTLERQAGRKGILAKFLYRKPCSKSGLTGEVNLYTS